MDGRSLRGNSCAKRLRSNVIASRATGYLLSVPAVRSLDGPDVLIALSGIDCVFGCERGVQCCNVAARQAEICRKGQVS